jgi:hypothetical protein
MGFLLLIAVGLLALAVFISALRLIADEDVVQPLERDYWDKQD